MVVLEFKAITNIQQATAIDEAIRTGQFIQNKCLRAWIDRAKKSKYDLNKYCAELAKEFPFADQAKAHLKISRQRKEHAKHLARCVVTSNDVIAYEDLRIKNMVKNHCLAKSISDAAWYEFRKWIEYYGEIFGKITVAVPPQYTSQECSDCGKIVKKSLSSRTHKCKCGCELDRDHNAALNILSKAISTVGHSGTSILEMVNATGV